MIKKYLIKRLMNKKGFTLIELLVVISVIGVLAVAVLSSINPVEQINKAKDTASKSDASELLNATERFFSTFGCYPWNFDNAADACKAQAAQGVLAMVAVNNAGFKTNTLDVLSDSAEIKSEFVTRLNSTTNTSSNLLYISSAVAAVGEPELVHISFVPASKTWKTKAKATQNCSAFMGGTYFCIPGSE